MRTRSLFPLVVAAVLLAGCSPHPSGVGNADLTLPPSYSGSQVPEEATPVQDSRWWLQFGDPELDRLMEELFASGPDLAAATARLRQAEATWRSASSGLWPSLGLEGEGSRSRQPGVSADTEGHGWRLSAAASYEVDLWGKVASRSKAARLDAEAARLDTETLFLTLSAQLADLHFVAREQSAQLALTDATIASFEDTLERVQTRYREGVVPPIDLYQSRQNLAAARAKRPRIEAALAGAQHAISALLGRYPATAELTDASLPAPPPLPAPGVPADLLVRRPDVGAAFKRLEAQDARVAAAIAERLPGLSLVAGTGRSRSVFSSGTAVGLFWEVAGSLTQPLFDGGRRRAEVDAARAGFDAELATFRKTLLDAALEVEDALVNRQSSEERLLLLQENADAAEAALELALEGYLQGLTDYLPVLTFQTLHFEARSQLLDTRRQLLSDAVALARSLGGAWPAAEVERSLNEHNRITP